MFTAEHDPLRADRERYVARLNAVGVPARLIGHPGALHGTPMITRIWKPAAAWQREAAAALRDAHWEQARVEAS